MKARKMKEILMPFQPQWAHKILNGEKTIELRKRFPIDYRGWVYMYCTKGKPYLYKDLDKELTTDNVFLDDEKCDVPEQLLNGKVVARFWVDNVIKMPIEDDGYYSVKPHDIPMHACLTITEINQYGKGKDLFAIHISKLEIFDKPKEISEFYSSKWIVLERTKQWIHKAFERKPLTTAPQSYCYIDIRE